MRRNTLLLILAMILALSIAACGGGEEEAEESSDFSFALVLPGALGDRSFSDSANRGAE